MWICAFRSLRPRSPWSLLLALLLLPTSPAVVQAASATEATTPDCAQSGLEPRPVAIQLTRKAEGRLVQATLHAPSGALPAIGCRIPLRFQVPEDARPRYAVWRDVETRAVRPDGTPDPTRPDPLPLRLWIHPDGVLQYEVREAGVKATHAALNLAVAWGTTAAANDLAVLDILSYALGLDLDFAQTGDALDWALEEIGALLDERGRVMYLDWYAIHPSEEMDFYVSLQGTGPEKRGLHPPDVRTTWQLPSELGQLTEMYKLALGGPLLTGAIPPELGQLANLQELTLAGSRLTGAVPPELGQLTRLRKLELHDNRLTALPPELGRLTLLQELGLAGNRLTALPPELGQIIELRKLGLADNRLTALPPELGRLTLLQELGLASNQLTVLPSKLGKLRYLEALDVQDNQLTALPSLARRTRLEYLDLSGNRLTTLPPAIGRLRLKSLDLSDNQLTALPRALGRLRPPAWVAFFHAKRQLTLDLSGNQLTELPPALGRVSHLVALGSQRQSADRPAEDPVTAGPVARAQPVRQPTGNRAARDWGHGHPGDPGFG